MRNVAAQKRDTTTTDFANNGFALVGAFEGSKN